MNATLYCLLFVPATFLFVFVYSRMTHDRFKEYLAKTDLTEEARRDAQDDATHDFITLVARMVIWLFCSVCALYKNVPCIILSMVFTVDALGWIAKEAYHASKIKAVTLFFLGLPFAASAMFHCFNAGLLAWGIILFVVIAALEPASYLIARYLSKKERK